MPNYTLYATPVNYNPLSFLEMWAPIQAVTELHYKMADAYDELEMQAATLEKLADSSIDQEQYLQYKAYADLLKTAANNLATYGAAGQRAAQVRSDLSRMRKDYAGQIQPIMDAYALREEERKEQHKLKEVNPSIMFERDADVTGLGSYMAGSPANKVYKGSDLLETAQSAAENLKIALNDPESSLAWSGIIYSLDPETGERDNQYWQRTLQLGATIENVNNALAALNGNLDIKLLTDIEKAMVVIGKQSLALSGLEDWSNWGELSDKALSYVGQGLWKAIGKKDYDTLANRFTGAGGSSTKDTITKPIERTTTVISIPDTKKVKEYQKLTEKVSVTPEATLYYTEENLKSMGITDASSYRQAINSLANTVERLKAEAGEDLKKLEEKEKLYRAEIRIIPKTTTEGKKKDFITYCKDLGLTADEIATKFNNVQIGYVDFNGLDSSIPAVLQLIGEAQKEAVEKRLEQEGKSSKVREYENAKYRLEDLQTGFDKQYKLSDNDKELLTSLGVTEEEFYKNPTKVSGLMYEDTLTDLDSSTTAGKKFKEDAIGTVLRNIPKDNILIFHLRGNKNGKLVSDRQANKILELDNILRLSIDPQSIRQKQFTILTVDKEYYSVPLEYLGTNVLNTLEEPIFPIGERSYSLLEARLIAENAKDYLLAHAIDVKIADIINEEFGYNFYLSLGDTKNP